MPANSELPMRAIATMVNDETQDVTPLVNWRVSSEEFATINHEGTLASSEVDEAEIVTVTAATIDINGAPISDTKDITINSDGVDGILPICGGVVDDTDQTNATGACLKTATDANGNWFTSTPSVAVMNALGYKGSDDDATANTDSNSGDTYASTYTEDGTYGPTGGEFAQFRQDGIDDEGVQVVEPGDEVADDTGVGGQFDRWCEKLNELEFGGRVTWERPTESELSAFYQKYEDEGAELGLWSARGWPTQKLYWSSTVSSLTTFGVYLVNGNVRETFEPGNGDYASCVSKNP